MTFRNKEEFATNVLWALSHEPEPLSPALRYSLSWEAATRRLIKASLVSSEEKMDSYSKTDKMFANLHTYLGTGKRGDLLRKIAGAKEAALQSTYEMPLYIQQQQQVLQVAFVQEMSRELESLEEEEAQGEEEAEGEEENSSYLAEEEDDEDESLNKGNPPPSSSSTSNNSMTASSQIQ